MMRMSRGMLLVLALVLLRPAGAGTDSEPDRSLLMLRGTVAAIEETSDPSGTKWTDTTVVTPESGAAVRIRIAPSALLEEEAFRIAVGDTFQLRVFSDETPLAAQRIRNESTGRTLRIRCLHGELLWDDGRSPGSGDGRGGRRYRGGR